MGVYISVNRLDECVITLIDDNTSFYACYEYL